MNMNEALLKKETIISFFKQVLKGYGQIMLQDSLLTGAFFIIGIFIGSIEMGLTSLIAVVVATLFANLVKFEKANIDIGFYGFSATLVGVALSLFLKQSLILWISLIVGSIVAAWLQDFFIKKNIPAYTLPFVLVTWIVIFIAKNIDVNVLKSSEGIVDTLPLWAVGFISYGQVIFQGVVLAGTLFFIGVFINSPKAASFGLVSAFAASFISLYFNKPILEIEFGLYGFNAVLCGIAMMGNKITDVLWALIAVLFSLIVTYAFMRLGLTQLTFPFVISCLLVTYLKRGVANTK